MTVEVQPLAPLSAPISTNFTESYAAVVLPLVSGHLTGSSAVLFYELDWDQGTNGVNWSVYTVTSSLNVVVTNLTSGDQYQFKYRVQNILGWGPFSPVLTITAMVAPF